MPFTVYAGMVDEAFTGTLRKVVFDLHSMSHEDEIALHASHHYAAVGVGAAGST